MQVNFLPPFEEFLSTFPRNTHLQASSAREDHLILAKLSTMAQDNRFALHTAARYVDAFVLVVRAIRRLVKETG